jgi:HAD superfamily hydrolase (TIGR01458 family)
VAWLQATGGVLLDIDGTLLAGDRAIPGAAQALGRIRAAGIPYRLVTNTTRRSRREIHAVLQRAGIEVEPGEILAPSVLARREIVDSGRRRAALLIPAEAHVDFEGVVEDEEHPDWVVVGDLGRGFTWERLNRAFLWLHAGACLIALQKNRYWLAGAESGLVLDAGPFVAALEYAAGVSARIVGKPSPEFFRLAVEDLGIEPREAVMVGDDAAGDCGGGSRAGCRTILVRTGKFTQAAVREARARPDLVIDSVADLTP